MDRKWSMEDIAQALWQDVEETEAMSTVRAKGGAAGLRIAGDGFVSPDAHVIGDVQTGDGASIYPEVHVRAGEGGKVFLEDMCVLLDGAVVKASAGKVCRVGEGAVISQGAVVADCVIGAGSLIGRDAVILEGCDLAAGTVVHDGAVLPPGTVTLKAMLVKGHPPQVVRELGEDEVRNVVEANVRLRAECREYCLHAAVRRL